MPTITEERRQQTHFHPGEHIREELDAMAMAPEDLATKLGVSAEEMQEVLSCSRPLSAEFALRLSHFFGTSAQFWMNVQISYDLEKAELEHGAEIESLPTLQAA